MKKDIHPQYHTKAKIVCACGAEFSTGSTQKSMQVEICSNCHPVYTGKQKFVDTAGRVERYEKMAAKTRSIKETRKSKKSKRESK